jgi:uncharacterized protein YndB with AHSA1/START domain
MPTGRVELQAEVSGRRDDLYALVSTSEGLQRWLDDASIEPRVGGSVRLRLRGAVAVGRVLAIDPPQHVSWTWDWEADPLNAPSVVAFDLIDHAERTHLTVRHVGFVSTAQVELHDAMWRYWFGRLVAETERVATGRDATREGAAAVS